MSDFIKITNEDILQQVKISCKLPEIIEEIVTRKVTENAVAEMELKVETEELQQAADKFRLNYRLHSSDDTWVWLEKHHLSLDDFEALVYNRLISTKLLAHLFLDKIEPYFFENQLDYTSVGMYEVILDNEDLALELFYSIKQKEVSFFDVAHEHIQEPELRRRCGYRGRVNRKDLKPEISAAVFAAKPPQLLKPIVASRGVHLIFVEEIIQFQLDNYIRHKIGLDLLSDFLKQRIEQTKISICLD